jgi:hypothetical protein
MTMTNTGSVAATSTPIAALVYAIEAARVLCGGPDDLALDLLRMAVADVQASLAKAKRRNLSS